MSAFVDIRAALENEISNVVGIPPISQLSWENVKFDPTVGTPWARMNLIPTESKPAVMGPNPQLAYKGLFVVTIFMPEMNGPNAADILADAIRDSFNVNVVLTKNTTNVRFRNSERTQGRNDGPWYMLPIVIDWYSYRT